MASLTNQNKNSASVTNQDLSDNNLTWDEATMTEDAATFTWDRQTTFIANGTQHTASVTNQAKN